VDNHILAYSGSTDVGLRFLLARLHMNDIAAQQTRATLQSALQNLPSNINETYEKAMRRVRPADLSLAKCVVSWITHSLRPLTALELRTAIAVNGNVTKLSEMTLHLHSETHILSVCAGLVTIDAETSVIRLVHPTAEAYFRDYFTQACAHSAIATTCLHFVMLKDLQKVVFDFNKPDSDFIDEPVSGSQSVPFLNYAAQTWGHHVRQANDPATNQLAIEFLESNMSLNFVAEIMDSYHSGPASALWITAHFGLRDLADRILRKEPSTITEIMHGETVMHVTAETGYTGVMELLLATDGSIPDAINKSGRTPLTQAAENGHHQIVQLLLASNAVDPDFRDQTMFYEGRTPLSWAAGNGHETTVRYLLATDRVDANSTITKGLYAGRTPLFWAAAGGHGRVVRLLLEEGNADATICDNDGYSPLTIAAQHGHEDIITLLLQVNRAVADKKEKVYGRRPVEWAIECQHDAVAELLLMYPTLDFRHEHGRTTLSYEAEHGYAKGVEILIEMGASADVKDEDSWTPLMYAADGGHVDVVKALVRCGVDIDLTCADLRTSISYAAEAGHDKVVRVLLDYGASPEVPDCDQRTPLSYAAEHGHEVVVSLLLSSGRVNPDSRPNAGLYAGRTPLSFAAARGKLDIVQMLLDKGVTVDVAKTESGWGTQTPLQWAISNGHEAVAKLLLNLG
jgi:ankyrin repeat protein